MDKYKKDLENLIKKYGKKNVINTLLDLFRKSVLEQLYRDEGYKFSKVTEIDDGNQKVRFVLYIKKD